MIENVDYFVYLDDLPTCKCGGIVMPNDDGTFTIILNSRLTKEKNIESFVHELKHIDHGDFYRSTDIDTMEKEASA